MQEQVGKIENAHAVSQMRSGIEIKKEEKRQVEKWPTIRRSVKP